MSIDLVSWSVLTFLSIVTVTFAKIKLEALSKFSALLSAFLLPRVSKSASV